MLRLLALCLVLIASLPAWADEASAERWYVVQMQGQRCGWMREQRKREGENWRSESELKLEIKRGAVAIGIGIESSFVESEDHKPVSMSSTMKLGAMPQGKRYRFLADGVEVIETSMGKDLEPKTEPLPEGEWLTPLAVEKRMAERIAAGDKEVVVRSIDPSTGLKILTATNTLLERTTLEVVGRVAPALKWETKVDLYPTIASTTFTDERGRPLRNETDVGGIRLMILRADRDLALAKMEPPELLMSTLITPDRPIPKPRELARAVYMIESAGESLAEIPTQGGQRFERTGPKSGRVVVTAGKDGRASAPAEEVKDAGFTDCTTMISCADGEVKALAARALAKGASPTDKAARAEALRKFVYGYISKKSLDVGFATAAEVARTRAGDCSEHGVLLCALLRADGIPARVVSGLVYVDQFAEQDNVFGYHMWTQALLDDGSGPKWVDLDAALSRERAFDATHIALTTSSLGEGEMTNSLVQLAPLLGTISIKVESVE